MHASTSTVNPEDGLERPQAPGATADRSSVQSLMNPFKMVFVLVCPFVIICLPPQESVRAIGKVKVMFFMPILQCAAIVAFLVPWVIYSVFTASLAEVSNYVYLSCWYCWNCYCCCYCSCYCYYYYYYYYYYK